MMAEPTPLKRASLITIDDQDDHGGPPKDRQWVLDWLKRWEDRVRVARSGATNGVWTWDVEGPAEAIAEIPEHLLEFTTPWAPHYQRGPVAERKDRRHGGR